MEETLNFINRLSIANEKWPANAAGNENLSLKISPLASDPLLENL